MDRRGGMTGRCMPAGGGRGRAQRLAAGLCALVALAACEAGPSDVSLRGPDLRVVAAGAAHGALTSSLTGGTPIVGAFTGAAGTFVHV